MRGPRRHASLPRLLRGELDRSRAPSRPGVGAHGITARYYRGRTNITAAVRAGTYATASLAPRASVVLRVVVRAARSSAAQATFLTTARSQAGTPRDAVRLVARAFG
jgi:gamma-glutamyl phosphate reductase